ncbi:uncharacterized protein ATNIH1004_001672 [Aspergillus tanneri]|uniref:Uncharacterized protein n=1 Tax=Aspergillus tanneri TaxID=1220188 RepID=A0A5M9NDG5_9EURO|nr:uncharacterized protein ATNIH1004_001672 [Aspergillus tanneri]KAA8652767.1 hypothetical protein ATNIH1004_001672 [Aspergillus tanneri]
MDFQRILQNPVEQMFRTEGTTSSIQTSVLDQRIIEDSIKVFEQQLEKSWARQRAPRGLKKHFLGTRTSDASVTSRIFLETGGLKSWLAHFLATKGKAHFKGQHQRSTTLAAFHELSLENRKAVARKVANVHPHPTVSRAIHRISKNFTDEGLLESFHNENSRHSSTNSDSTRDLAIASMEGTRRDPNYAFDSSRHIEGPAQHVVLEKASLQGIADIFDQYMCSAIRKDRDQCGESTCLKAAVTMDFPFDGLVDCLMSLAIDQSKVEYLAMALFNLHVESAGQVRYLILNEGAKVIPNPDITLKGVLDDAIIRILGPDIHSAIRASRMRRKELEEGNRVTECVSMIITNKANEGAIINLSLGLKDGAQIQNKLYT